MKSTLISKENNEAKFRMEFSSEEFEDAVIKVYQKEKGKFTIDGFRKGKAPRSLIEKHYGEGIFFEDAINNLFGTNYPLALNELEVNAIDYPRTEFGQVKKGEAFDITVTVAVYPEFEVKDYKGVEIETVKAEVTDADVDKEIENLATRNSRMVEVERPAQNGDTVLIDYKGFVGEEQFEGGTAEKHPLKLGSNTFIPGFEDQLIGVVKGEERDVKVAFPEKYHSKDLAGKEAVFKCKVHEIKEQEMPVIDDEFVKDVSEFDTMEELKASKREELQKAAEVKAENEMRNSVIEKVYEANEIDVPEVMVQQEIEQTLNEFDQQLKAQGMDLKTYMQHIGEDVHKMTEQLRGEAYKKTKTRMLISAIADQENFEVSDEEVNAEMENMAKQYGLEVDKLKEMVGEQNLHVIRGDLKVKKAVEYIYDNAIKK